MRDSKIAAIIGYPLGHSMSPVMHNAGFAALGSDTRYEAWPIPSGDLPATIQRVHEPEILGLSVTVPYKQAVMPLLDEIDRAAEAIGSVNTVVKRGQPLVGYNTDKDGFIRSLREEGCEPAGLRALVLGVGGAERAVAYGLVEAGVSAVMLAGRNPQRVSAAVDHLKASRAGRAMIKQMGFDELEVAEAARDADLIVNTTPIGMRHSPQENESALPVSALRPGVWVVDIVYNPLETVLLSLARQAGAYAVDGLGMLVYQGVAQQVLWTGQEPPSDIMRDAALAAMRLQE